MYPIDCFEILEPCKMEAVRYYIDINKKFLKETSREEYESFSEFLKGEGKDIMQAMLAVKTNKELYALLLKIEKALPYYKELSKAKTFENKIAFIHRAFAKLRIEDELKEKSYSQVLKMQRQMALDYDVLQDTVAKYRDNAVSYEEIKEQLKDSKTMAQLLANSKGFSSADVINGIKSSLEQKKETLKEKRAEAFNKISEYYIKEQVYVLEQERLAGVER